jgi:radical SAM protein with 4Fe4S-binding SPASM domain
MFNSSLVLPYIFLTHRCNCGCPYCFEKNIKPADDITEETLSHVMKTFLALRNRGDISMLAFGFWGGEPLLNFDAVANVSHGLCKEFKELKYINMMMVTNLTVLPQSFLSFYGNFNLTVMAGMDSLSVSKPYKTGENTVRDVLWNIKELQYCNPARTIIIQTTMTNGYNFADLKEIAEFIIENNFSWYLNSEYEFNNKDADVFEIAKNVIKRLDQSGYNIKRKFKFNGTRAIPYNTRIDIDCDGRVYPCPFYFRKNDIKELSKRVGPDILSIYHNALAQYKGKYYWEIPGKCKLCQMFEQCNIYKVQPYFKVSDYLCEFSKKIDNYIYNGE